MANTTPLINTKKVNPGLKDLLDIAKRDIFLNLYCHAIGIIQSFNAETQTASVNIAYTQNSTQINEDGTQSIVQKNYPSITDAPVICLGGGDWSLTFPIAPGDTCLVLFNDRSIDNWYQSGLTGPLSTNRLHSFADPLILVGPRSSQDVIANYDTTRAVLANGQTMVGIGESLIKIANATTTLNTLLQSLISAVNAIKIDPGTFNISAIPVAGQGEVASSSQSALSSIASDIAGLLE